MSKYTFLMLSLILFGCQNKNPCETLEENVPSKDGVIVSYEVSGCGDIALIFIHGWCSNRSFWNEQLDTLSQLYKTIAIDLPGHGESGRNRNKWSISSFADDVESVVRNLKLDHFVLIGHSMGGLVSLEVASRLQDKVIGLIAIESISNVDSVVTPETMEPFFGALEKNFSGTLRMAMPRMFSPQTSEELIHWVTDNSIRADSIMAISIARDVSMINEKDLLSSVKIPVRCIYGEYGDLNELQSRVEANSKYADYGAVFIKDVGHFLFLEKPKETNKYLIMYITELLGRYIATDK
jgi:pimeloyl-ACP methyl ester carboxylesterase